MSSPSVFQCNDFWQLLCSMDANDLDNLPGKEGKIVLLALLKMIFFHTDRNESSDVTLE